MSEQRASLPLTEFGPLRRQPVLPHFFEQVRRPMDRQFLEPVTIAGNHERVQVPTSSVGGWYDIFLADTLTNFSAMRQLGRPTRLLIGPCTHMESRQPVGELNFGFGSQAGLINLQYDMDRLQLRWFFVMGANVGRDEAEWPLARAVPTWK